LLLKELGEEATYYYHPDHLGSVSVVSNHRGEPYEKVEYLPFGEIWIEETDPATGYIPFRFTSKELDEETGLYYYGARYYEPATSRWISPDPAGFELINPMESDGEGGWEAKESYSVIEALNWYSYVSNNPVKYVDPTGMEEETLVPALTDVVVPADGKIIAINEWADISEYGNNVVIEHADGKFSVMAHLEGFAEGLSVGDSVKQGDKVATAGGTGTIEGMAPHLHWAVFDGVDSLHAPAGDKGIFLGKDWIVNMDKSVDPQTLIDSGEYIHPSDGIVTSDYGDRSKEFPNSPQNFHEGMDYSLRTRRE